MVRRPRKSSACVTLVLIGAAALSGCGDSSTPNRRAQYATKEECLADWGDPKDCEQQQALGGDGSRSHFYWGPSGGYSGGHSGGWAGFGSGASAGGHSITHGGFGAHGSSSS